MKPRVELTLLNKNSIEKLLTLKEEYNLINVYIRTNIFNLSETRKNLIDLGYTTRLFVVLDNNQKVEYIYGKLKGQNGVFRENCKNSIFRKPLHEVIQISSEKNNTVILDDILIKNSYTGDHREWILI